MGLSNNLSAAWADDPEKKPMDYYKVFDELPEVRVSHADAVYFQVSDEAIKAAVLGRDITCFEGERDPRAGG